MTDQQTDQERDDLELEPQTVGDLEAEPSDVDDVRGGGKCITISLGRD